MKIQTLRFVALVLLAGMNTWLMWDILHLHKLLQRSFAQTDTVLKQNQQWKDLSLKQSNVMEQAMKANEEQFAWGAQCMSAAIEQKANTQISVEDFGELFLIAEKLRHDKTIEEPHAFLMTNR